MRWTALARFTIIMTTAIIFVSSANAQYDLVFPGTPPRVPVDTLNADTTAMDTTATEVDPVIVPPPAPAEQKDYSKEAVKLATTWLRRLIFRGWLDDNVTGTWAEYQLTDWRPSSGSYGPVQGKLTVYYLGATNWMGKPSAKIQAVFRALDENSTVVEFDLMVSAAEKITEVHRALYRVNRGPLSNAAFGLPEERLDFDKLDRPKDDGFQELKLYSGTYATTLYKGSGTDGAVVYAYKAEKLPPINLVVLGYGEQAMTVTSFSDGAEPRFETPAPSVR